MSTFGTLLRRNFEPVVLSVQVLVDLLVLLLSCWLGYLLGERLGGLDAGPELVGAQRRMYQELSALIAAVSLVSFHAFGMYSPRKSLLNVEEYKAVAKATAMAFLALFTLVIFLRSTRQDALGPLYGILVPLHQWIDLDVNVHSVSRLTVLLTFGMILVLTTASRFASFRAIQHLHRLGIGNRNVIIYGAGELGQQVQRKFAIVPTLGLNLIGFVDDDPARTGELVERTPVLGTSADLEQLVGRHKVSEVFLTLPEASDEHIMEIVGTLQRLGVVWKVVPRFHHLLASKVRIETLDSIPLVTPSDRTPGPLSAVAKRVLDLVMGLAVVLLTWPLWVLAAILIRRESPGPVFFVQERVGRNGRRFRMVKFRTMRAELSGDALKPRSGDDGRITRIGRWLRRTSLDELPQFLNVLAGDMSVVGPRPEMSFIVEKYGPLERERLRVKPGITGLWQISYARAAAIHENLDYDLYYIEHQSLLLDVVIIALTLFAVVKGTGAY